MGDIPVKTKVLKYCLRIRLLKCMIFYVCFVSPCSALEPYVRTPRVFLVQIPAMFTPKDVLGTILCQNKVWKTCEGLSPPMGKKLGSTPIALRKKKLGQRGKYANYVKMIEAGAHTKYKPFH